MYTMSKGYPNSIHRKSSNTNPSLIFGLSSILIRWEMSRRVARILGLRIGRCCLCSRIRLQPCTKKTTTCTSTSNSTVYTPWTTKTSPASVNSISSTKTTRLGCSLLLLTVKFQRNLHNSFCISRLHREIPIRIGQLRGLPLGDSLHAY